MAVYKVPQDVEAEDKLIGPFSFRQFIYLGVVALGIGAGWGLALVFPPLAVIPLPIVIFFGALALPLRKDQPMETYLAAMWQFYTKTRRRMWMADGVVSRITIDVPAVVERQLIKQITSDQAISQFDYLSQIADSGGWSTRGVAVAPVAVVDNPADDILDGASAVAQSFDTRLQRGLDERREDLLARVQTAATSNDVTPLQAPQPYQYVQPRNQPLPQISQGIPASPYGSQDDTFKTPVFDPAPAYMQQHVIQPLGASGQSHAPAPAPYTPPAPAEPVQNPVEPEPSVATPAIMELAKGVSVETVAKQLHHEEVERTDDGDIIINLH